MKPLACNDNIKFPGSIFILSLIVILREKLYRAIQYCQLNFYANPSFNEDKWELVEIDGDSNEIDTIFKPVAFDEPKIIKSMIKEYKAMCEIKRSDIADYLGITDDTLKTWETGK